MAKTTVTIGTLRTKSGSEYVPSTHQPAFKLQIAEDGQACVVYWYPNPAGDHNVYAFRYSNADRTVWSDEIVLASYATNNDNNVINRITACMDPSGNVHAGWLCYQNVRNYGYYCMLTKAPTGGWTAGEVDPVNVSPYDLGGANRQWHVSHDGTRPFISFHDYEGYYQMFPYALMSRYPGQNPLWQTVDLPFAQGGAVACHVGSKSGYTVNVYEHMSGTDWEVRAKVYQGTNLITSETALWTEADGMGTGDDYTTIGLVVYPLTHVNVDFIVVTRLTADVSLRLWKYKIGVGWTGEVVLKVGDVSAGWTYATWDADAGVMHFWYNSNGACLQWDPNDDSVADSGMVGMRSAQMTQTVYDGKVHGFSASGTGGTATLYYRSDDRSFLRKARQDVLIESRRTISKPIVHTTHFESRFPLFAGDDVPLAATGWVYPVDQVPEEYREWIVRPHQENLVFEKLQTDRIQYATGLAWEGTLQNGIWIKNLPLEFRTTLALGRPVGNAQRMIAEFGAAELGAAEFGGEASEAEMYDPGMVQIEWRKAWPERTEPFGTDAWFEVLRGLWATKQMVMESIEPIVVVLGNDLALALDVPIGTVVTLPFEGLMGVSDCVYHNWNVLREALGVLPHIWQVQGTLGTPSLLHQWTVVEAHGQGLPHLWRVLPAAFVLLHGEDIQLPFASVEKKAQPCPMPTSS